MANRNKVITMTQLALYDKHEGPADRVANDYFRHDFIYRNNLGTRLAVGLGGIIILVIYWVQSLAMYDMDLFEFNIQEHVTDSVMFLLAILAVYSLIGSIQGTRQYYLVQKRLAQYQAIVRQLERLNEREHHFDDEFEEPVRDESFPPVRMNNAPPLRTAPIEHTRALEIEHERPRSRQVSPSSPAYTRPPRRPQNTALYGQLHERERPLERTRTPGRSIDPSITPDMARPITHTRAHEPPRLPIEHTKRSEPISPEIEHKPEQSWSPPEQQPISPELTHPAVEHNPKSLWPTPEHTAPPRSSE